MNRRHHCRACGALGCYACCGEYAVLVGSASQSRVCLTCKNKATLEAQPAAEPAAVESVAADSSSAEATMGEGVVSIKAGEPLPSGASADSALASSFAAEAAAEARPTEAPETLAQDATKADQASEVPLTEETVSAADSPAPLDTESLVPEPPTLEPVATESSPAEATPAEPSPVESTPAELSPAEKPPVELSPAEAPAQELAVPEPHAQEAPPVQDLGSEEDEESKPEEAATVAGDADAAKAEVPSKASEAPLVDKISKGEATVKETTAVPSDLAPAPATAQQAGGKKKKKNNKKKK